MSSRNFRAMLEEKWNQGKFACVGLDPDMTKIPAHIKSSITGGTYAIEEFCLNIVAETADLVCAYKPNIAFFERLDNGETILADMMERMRQIAPDVPIILDAKRGDIGNSNVGYVQSLFARYKADATTIHPYLGQEANQVFLNEKSKGIFVLCRTSNEGAGEFQDHGADHGSPLFRKVAYNVAHKWNANRNCGLVVGATYAEELGQVRGIVGFMPILIPGVGAQGSDFEHDVEMAVQAGKDSRMRGIIVNASRSIIYASAGDDYAEAARRETLRLHVEINKNL